MGDPVNHPDHYTQHQAEGGIECIDCVEWMPFNVGNAVKYLWRYREKGKPLEDLEKAWWYLQRERERCERETKSWVFAHFSFGGSRWGEQGFADDETMRRAEIGAGPVLLAVLRALRPAKNNTPAEYMRGLVAAREVISDEMARLRRAAP